jgi:CHAT domain-containing protein
LIGAGGSSTSATTTTTARSLITPTLRARIRARSTVLSGACAPGLTLRAPREPRGDITATGHVVGLARGLLAAGVRRVVVSLWPVDDRVGCLTMAAMAQRLAAGEPVASALAAAQRAVLATAAATRGADYAALAAAADTPAVASGRRVRDARPKAVFSDPPPDHPTWAPFVHIGL